MCITEADLAFTITDYTLPNITFLSECPTVIPMEIVIHHKFGAELPDWIPFEFKLYSSENGTGPSPDMTEMHVEYDISEPLSYRYFQRINYPRSVNMSIFIDKGKYSQVLI